MKKIFIILAFFSTTSHGIVNIEKVRKKDLKDGWKLQSSFNFTHLSGNSESKTYEGEGRLDYKKNDSSLLFLGELEQAKASGKKYKNAGSFHTRFTEKLASFYAVETFAQIEFNDFIYLEERDLVGMGLRFTFFDTPTFNFHLGNGFFYEKESHEEDFYDTEIIRSNNYLSFRYDKEKHFYIASTAYYQVDSGRADDYRILVNSTLGFHLAKNMSLDFIVDYRYDNEPVLHSLDRQDLEIKNGITISF